MEKVTKEQALRLIGNDKEIHTYRKYPMALLGEYWSRTRLLQAFDKYEDTLQLSGETAVSLKHGLVLKDNKGYLFIKTIEQVLSEVEKECENNKTNL